MARTVRPMDGDKLDDGSVPTGVSIVERSNSGLCEVMFQALDDLRHGRIDEKRANAIAGLATVVIKSAEMQMKFEKMKKAGELPDGLGDMKLVRALPSRA